MPNVTYRFIEIKILLNGCAQLRTFTRQVCSEPRVWFNPHQYYKVRHWKTDEEELYGIGNHVMQNVGFPFFVTRPRGENIYYCVSIERIALVSNN